MIKRWLPFIFLITIALIAFINLLFFSDDPYKPRTDDPDLIYYQACSDCHGDTGQGSGLLYPAFDSLMSKVEIEKNIIEGGWLMPKFSYIHGDTLQKLVNYIYDKKYRN